MKMKRLILALLLTSSIDLVKGRRFTVHAVQQYINHGILRIA
jgi:hypothetical protein